jgi:hypothetical protein
MKTRIALLLSPALALAVGPSPARADNVGSCGSLTVVNGANDCYVVTPPVVGVEPTIDGQIVGLEWTSALAAKTFNNAGGDLTASIQFLRTPTKLFFFVTVADNTFNAADNVELYFDPLHNDQNGNSATASENWALRVRRDGTFAVRTGTGSFVAGPLAAGVAAARTGGGAADPDWRAEVSIEPVVLGLTQFGPLLGFGAMASSSDGSANTWPGDFDPDSLSTSWANIKTRFPYRIALSLDFSGSMLAEDVPGPNRWKRAVRAAKMFELVARAVGRQNHFSNEVNANRWAWLCSGDAAANNLIDLAANNKSAVALGTLTLSDWIATDPDGNNCTPIKKGVEKALANATLDERQPLIILLSDGLHNMPSTDIPFSGTVAGLTNTRVHTIAVGADGVADTTLLANIAASAAAGSNRLPSTYVQRDLTDELLDAYITALSTFFEVQWSSAGPSGATFTPGNAIGDKLIFVGVWDDPAAAGSLTVTRAATGAVTGAETTDTTAGITVEEIATDAALAGGDWTVSGTGASRIFALVDPRITATPILERRIRAAGEPMLLQLDVRAGTLPLTGIEASVEIAHPNESLGTFLATIQPNCERGEPFLPGRDGGDRGDPKKNDQIRLGRIPPLALSWAGPGVASAAAPAGGDPIPGRYALAHQYFERCQKRGLERGALPGQQLVDDGSSGDLVAGDGIYSFLFTLTSKEGSYNFRFHARGSATVSPAPVPTPDGGPPEIPTMDFERTSLESIYVGVFPAPSATTSSFVTGAVIGDFQIGFGFILPRDTVGNYLGPGFAGAFTTTAVGGVLVGNVLDLGNGVYGQQLKFPRNGRPGVVFEMKEPCFKQGVGPGAPTSTGCGPEECKSACRTVWWKIARPWLALLLGIILIIIVIALIKKRRP